MTREEAITELELFKKSALLWNEMHLSEAIDMAIESLQTKAVQGEWIENGGELVCSACGNSVSFSRTPKGWVLGKFCQTCGARMQNEKNEK